MSNITYRIRKVNVLRDSDGLSDVVGSVVIDIMVEDDRGSAVNEEHTVTLSTPNPSTFTELDSLDKDTVIVWFKEAFYVDGLTEVDYIAAALQKIADNQNSYSVTPNWN
jgi:hypothetical protein